MHRAILHGMEYLYSLLDANTDLSVTRVFERSFSDSEGAEEGALIANLARALLTTTPPGQLFAFGAHYGSICVGAVIFTEMVFAQDARRVVLLSPLAVRTEHQRRGVGQDLVRFALAHVAQEGCEVALTYGDPGYYGRFGFQQITNRDAQPPHPLSQPMGWLGLSLSDRPFSPVLGPGRTAPALDDPAFW